MNRFEGKVGIVAGAASGIGHAMALRLAERWVEQGAGRSASDRATR